MESTGDARFDKPRFGISMRGRLIHQRALLEPPAGKLAIDADDLERAAGAAQADRRESPPPASA
jgi:hypothetical protein